VANCHSKLGVQEMNDVRIIKRYQNRKLYDTHQSCYVTLEEIAQIIREGHEIQVIDNKTKNDITYTTQIQLLFDQEKKSTKAGDTELLKRVIRSPEGTFTGYIRNVEGLEAPEVTETTTTTEEFKPFMANEVNTSTESTNTLN
jgi:polyhydroxyalkanoate synthesis repressor PhaR